MDWDQDNRPFPRRGQFPFLEVRLSPNHPHRHPLSARILWVGGEKEEGPSLDRGAARDRPPVHGTGTRDCRVRISTDGLFVPSDLKGVSRGRCVEGASYLAPET